LCPNPDPIAIKKNQKTPLTKKDTQAKGIPRNAICNTSQKRSEVAKKTKSVVLLFGS
jgi:hypothetical protein